MHGSEGRCEVRKARRVGGSRCCSVAAAGALQLPGVASVLRVALLAGGVFCRPTLDGASAQG